jgi:hypothetical protein
MVKAVRPSLHLEHAALHSHTNPGVPTAGFEATGPVAVILRVSSVANGTTTHWIAQVIRTAVQTAAPRVTSSSGVPRHVLTVMQQLTDRRIVSDDLADESRIDAVRDVQASHPS